MDWLSLLYTQQTFPSYTWPVFLAWQEAFGPELCCGASQSVDRPETPGSLQESESGSGANRAAPTSRAKPTLVAIDEHGNDLLVGAGAC